MTGLALQDQARQLADSARAFGDALDRSPADQAIAEQELEQAAREWAARAEALQGFADKDGAGAEALSPEERLDALTADLDVAEVLLAAGLAAEEVQTASQGRLLIDTSIGRLESDLATQRSSVSATAGFAAPPALATDPQADFTATSRSLIDAIVSGTSTVLEDSWKRLRDLPAGLVAKSLREVDDVLDVAPQVGRFIRLGLQAVKRALLSLLDLVPQSLKNAVRDRAQTWWEASGDDVQHEVVARLVAAQEARDAVIGLNASTSDPELLRAATERVRELGARFARLVDAFGRVLRALAAAVTVATLVAAVVAAIAAWVPLAATAGYLLAAGSIIMVARDYLDTGGVLTRVDGVKQILSGLERD